MAPIAHLPSPIIHRFAVRSLAVAIHRTSMAAAVCLSLTNCGRTGSLRPLVFLPFLSFALLSSVLCPPPENLNLGPAAAAPLLSTPVPSDPVLCLCRHLLRVAVNSTSTSTLLSSPPLSLSPSLSRVYNSPSRDVCLMLSSPSWRLRSCRTCAGAPKPASAPTRASTPVRMAAPPTASTPPHP